MYFLRAFKVALTALAANKLRSVLAVLGIVIGVSAVIMMIGMGQGAQAKVEEGITKLGVNLIFIYPGYKGVGSSHAKTTTAETLSLEDCSILSDLPGVAQVAPEVKRYYQLKYMSQNTNAQVMGTTPNTLAIRDFKMARGTFFDKSHVLGRLRVAVLGARVAQDLFGDIDPVGRTLQIDRKNFQVLGVLEDKGGGTWANLDETVYVPVTTALYRLFNRRHLSQVTLQAETREQIPQLLKDLDEMMRRLHKITGRMEPDFILSSMDEWRQRMEETTGAFTKLLSGIAAVSLLVGGIGIMNIMLVSVTERTREIGIRKAIGARRSDILKQFLIESVTISLLGGLLGILIGIVGAQVVTKLPLLKSLSNGGDWDAVISPASIVVSFGFSCLVGIFFGIYPAMKASRLNPVEALRYE
jgi:putative ABC transport system permease protein